MIRVAGIQAVVIGASAGGLEALEMLLPALDPRCSAPVLVVLHLPRRRPSLLEGLFEGRCALPVRETVDKQPLQGGAIHFAPPDYHLLVERTGDVPSVALSMDAPVLFSRPSIDVLFESAADCWQNGLMGVLLSGSGEDGVAGLGAIVRAGGVTIVQQPAEARTAALPTAAIGAGNAQHVLRIAQIGRIFSEVGYAA